MTPVETAKELLGREWLDALSAHLMNGYVISHPDAFLMGRPVPLGVDVLNPWQTWPNELPSAWFVYAAAGPIRKLLDMMPYRLPFIGFMRQGRNWRDIHWFDSLRFESALAKFPKML